jgi:hypothetical protein
VPNIFHGLLVGAHDGEPYYVITRRHGGKKNGKRTCERILTAAASNQGQGPARSFPMPVFEAAILHALREVNHREIVNGDEEADETLELAKMLAGVEAEEAEAKAFLICKGFNQSIGDHLVRLADKKVELGSMLAEARHRQEHPMSEAWGECQTLAGVLATSPDPVDTRLRLRAAIKTIVDKVYLLIVNRGGSSHGGPRLALVDVVFKSKHEGRRRCYVVEYHRAVGNRFGCHPGSWRVCSFMTEGPPADHQGAKADVGFDHEGVFNTKTGQARPVDLSSKADAAFWEKWLRTCNLTRLMWMSPEWRPLP